MPLKPGGGNHMKLYDRRNGEYTEQEKRKMREFDNVAIASYKWNKEIATYKFHFPVEGVHELEYCKEFVRCIRNDIKEPKYDGFKMSYLLSFHPKNDKSKFLKRLGYSETKPQVLFHDICLNTLRDTIEFSRFSHGVVLLKANTYLKGKIVRTIWKLDEKLGINFVTLIPGGVKNE